MHQGLVLSPLFRLGMVSFIAFYAGKFIKKLSLPSLLGFMLTGAVMGPSFFNVFDLDFQHHIDFITEIALGFVAISIGLELNLKTLKKQGIGILSVIFSESFMAFFIVAVGVYLFTKDIPLALVFGAIAPASAPAGTVAVIQEYKASGPLTKALYTVVGFDDGLGIIIFGFASAFAKITLEKNLGGRQGVSLLEIIKAPVFEVVMSILCGIVIGAAFCYFSRKLESSRDIFVILFSTILIITGLCIEWHLSFILTNMIAGIFIVNTQPKRLISAIEDELKRTMPLLFLLFFLLAGAHLDIKAVPALGMLGILYIILRSVGLLSGAWIGARLGRLDKKIQKYLGLGILSQAGVAIGLSLLVVSDFEVYGEAGRNLGSTVLTTTTATCIIFEIVGPILTKIALKKAGEIKTS